MRTMIIASICSICILLSNSCANVYHAQDSETQGNMKTIAILPFDVQVLNNRFPKNITAEQVHENELELAFIIQNQIYAEFLRRSHKLQATFQDIDMTNMMLRRNNIDISKLGEFSKDELARLLEVDEVLSGSVFTTKPMSTGAAVAMGVIFDIWGPTNQADVTVSLHSGTDSNLLWKWNQVYSGSIGSSPDQLTKSMMRPLTRKFPYRKKG